jgi:hypothetical protein
VEGKNFVQFSVTCSDQPAGVERKPSGANNAFLYYCDLSLNPHHQVHYIYIYLAGRHEESCRVGKQVGRQIDSVEPSMHIYLHLQYMICPWWS